jgi:hypothetical protein
MYHYCPLTLGEKKDFFDDLQGYNENFLMNLKPYISILEVSFLSLLPFQCGSQERTKAGFLWCKSIDRSIDLSFRELKLAEELALLLYKPVVAGPSLIFCVEIFFFFSIAHNFTLIFGFLVFPWRFSVWFPGDALKILQQFVANRNAIVCESF